jgi:hypothetical protein
VATMSGEGGQTIDMEGGLEALAGMEGIDSELTNPSGLNVRDMSDRALAPPAPKPSRPLGGNDSTNVDLPVVRDDGSAGGPATARPGTKADAGTHVGPAPEPPLAPRPSAPRSTSSGPVLVPRPSAPQRPQTRPPGYQSGSVKVADELTNAGPVLVPRPSAPRASELATGPRTGTPLDVGNDKTSLKQGVDDQNTVARAPVIPELTPLAGSPLMAKPEETRIHNVGTPLASKPNASGVRAVAISGTKPVVSTVPPPPETAADRARKRRDAERSVWLMVAYKWAELPQKARVGAMVGGAALLLIGALTAVLVSSTPDRPKLPPEPSVLTLNEELNASFGLGPDVMYEAQVEKSFTFDLNSPTEAAVLVHLRGSDLDREEVGVSVNGNDVGFVPEDLGDGSRELEVLVPPRALLRGQQNIITFDNRKTDGKQHWRIADLKLEVLALPPEVREGQSLGEAQKHSRTGADLLQGQQVPTQNIYKAWRLYRQAWVLLLALPEDKRTTLFADARAKHAELGRELDQRCRAYLLDAKKNMELRYPDRAREILEEVPLHFPGKDHRCQALARQKLEEYEL